jgi:hypothetical protein
VTVLEFVPEPGRVLEEAARTARTGLCVGALNRHSLLGAARRLRGGPVWGQAHLFTPRELVGMLRQAAGARARALRWKTGLWPLLPGLVASLPWGGFVGAAVELEPGS